LLSDKRVKLKNKYFNLFCIVLIQAKQLHSLANINYVRSLYPISRPRGKNLHTGIRWPRY